MEIEKFEKTVEVEEVGKVEEIENYEGFRNKLNTRYHPNEGCRVEELDEVEK